jgi:tRNA (cmo5U34)-methyltransferase
MSIEHPATASAAKFDRSRAADYAVQSRTALAGYDACHEIAACLLAAALGSGGKARILAVGVGGCGQEILTCGRLEKHWRFVGVDPSAPMLDNARKAIEDAGLADRSDLRLGTVADLAEAPEFDAATLIGVLHHLRGEEPKVELLTSVAQRLRKGAPLILAGNRGAYAGNSLFLAAWGERWRMHGEREDAIQARLGKILEGADPPASDSAISALLQRTGFGAPQLFFSSLFWGAWIAFRE